MAWNASANSGDDVWDFQVAALLLYSLMHSPGIHLYVFKSSFCSFVSAGSPAAGGHGGRAAAPTMPSIPSTPEAFFLTAVPPCGEVLSCTVGR